MGDAITGGTVYDLCGAKCDSGDIILQKTLFVRPSWDYHDIWEHLFPMGVDMLSEAVRLVENGSVQRTPQDEECATWEPSWDRPRLKRNELLALGGGAERW